jgi:hypothetical protein
MGLAVPIFGEQLLVEVAEGNDAQQICLELRIAGDFALITLREA